MINNIEQKIYPLGSRVLVKVLERQAQTESGIYIPETSQEKQKTGVVIAVGEDEKINVTVGDKVLLMHYAGMGINGMLAEYMLVNYSDILARVEDYSKYSVGREANKLEK